MKNFTYIDGENNLHALDCAWLRDMGLKETRWILDREWFIIYYDNKQMSFAHWAKK